MPRIHVTLTLDQDVWERAKKLAGDRAYSRYVEGLILAAEAQSATPSIMPVATTTMMPEAPAPVKEVKPAPELAQEDPLDILIRDLFRDRPADASKLSECIGEVHTKSA